MAVHSREATYETMYGVVRRPTHRNSSRDAARYEVSGHRFADLYEPHGARGLSTLRFSLPVQRTERVDLLE